MLQSHESFAWETTHMSISLIESKRASQKSLRSTVVSVAMHAVAITLAVYATASAKEMVKPAVEIAMPLYAPQPAKPDQPHTTASAHPPRIPVAPDQRVINPPITIPDQLPPIDPAGSLAPAESLFTIGGGDHGASAAPTDGGVDSGAPLSAKQVEKPALPRSGNPFPRYPSMLESSRVEGTVLAQFVVDTLGRADMSTFKILDSSNDLFSASLRSALVNWRFFPAEAGGRKVKQIVQLPLKFIAPNH
jgi:protein TonB